MTLTTPRTPSAGIRTAVARGKRLALAALLGLATLAVPGPAALAQTAGTAGAAPEVAPVITSPPPTITSPGVLSATPQNGGPGVLSAEPPGVGGGTPRVAGAPVVLPAGMPMTGDGSLADQRTESSDGN
jgi:hypothetical protein